MWCAGKAHWGVLLQLCALQNAGAVSLPQPQQAGTMSRGESIQMIGAECVALLRSANTMVIASLSTHGHGGGHWKAWRPVGNRHCHY